MNEHKRQGEYQKKKSPWIIEIQGLTNFIFFTFAERQGFEPRVPRSTTVFKTAAIDHSATSPKPLLQKYFSLKAVQRYKSFFILQTFLHKKQSNYTKILVYTRCGTSITAFRLFVKIYQRQDNILQLTGYQHTYREAHSVYDWALFSIRLNGIHYTTELGSEYDCSLNLHHL